MMLETAAILFYGIGDLWTTRIITKNPDGDEKNPLMKVILKKTGFLGVVIYKAVIMLLVFVYYPNMVWFLVLFGMSVTAWNLIQITLYNRAVERLNTIEDA